MLEYKFRDLVGHTILEEIRRVRVQWVKQLLSDTDLPMPAIARRSRFFHAPADVGRLSPGDRSDALGLPPAGGSPERLLTRRSA